MKSKKIIILLVIALFIGIFLLLYTPNIKCFEKKTLSFEELPTEVQTCLLSIKNEKGITWIKIVCVDKNDEEYYEHKTVWLKEPIWVWHYVLEDKRKRNKYIIDYGTASPWIIYKNKMYIPSEFNVFTGNGLFEAKYKEYHLK